MTYSIWMAIGKKFLLAIMSMLTPFIKEALENALKGLYNEAKKTENIWDDKLIEILAELLNIKLDR